MKSKGLYAALVLSCGIYFANEIIIGIVHWQNANYAKLFGGEHVILETGQGFVEGFTSKSREGETFYEFLRVPYGVAPVGELRFEPPKKYPAWTGVREALSYGNKCLQYDFIIRMIIGDEDCLNLNVYTPSTKILDPNSPEKLLPVVVFIYGGMFMFGQTDVYRPEYLMDEGVVLVTINYRLAAFGFLNTGDETITGNMGLKDQLLAFKWIQENIKSYGGDPDSVTLLGESAGGASIHYHMLSEQSKGLFHNAISMSGTVLNNWAFMKEPKEQAKYFGERVGCSTKDSKQMVKCLKEKDGREIANFFMESRDMLHHRYAAFAPSVEVGSSDAFLTVEPKTLLKQGEIVNKVPWIVGANEQEGLIYSADILTNKTASYTLSKHWFKYAPTIWHFDHFSKTEKKSVSKKLWNFYLRGHPEPLRLHESLRNLTAIFSDINFYMPMRETVELQAGNTTIYPYFYTYQAQYGLAQLHLMMSGLLPVVLDGLVGQAVRWARYAVGLQEKSYGACHTDELGIIFQLPALLNTVRPGSVDYQFSKRMVEHIAHFAKTGKPVDIDGIEWPKATMSKEGPLKYVKLDQVWTVVDEPFKERLDFVSGLLQED